MYKKGQTEVLHLQMTTGQEKKKKGLTEEAHNSHKFITKHTE